MTRDSADHDGRASGRRPRGVDRRHFLLGSLGAGMTALAGCGGSDGGLGGGGGDGGGGGGGGTPYHTWIPAAITESESTPTSDGSGSESGPPVAHIDFGALTGIAESNPDYGAFSFDSVFQQASGEGEGEGLPADPLLLGASGVIALAFIVGFGASRYNFSGQLIASSGFRDLVPGTPTPTPTPNGATATPDFGSTSTDRWTVGGNTLAATGEVDTEAVVTAAGEGFSEAGSVGDYTVYEGGSEGTVFAVSDGALLAELGEGGSRSQLEAAIAARNGDGERFYDADGDAAWAIDAVAGGDVVLGNVDPSFSGSGAAARLPEAASGASFGIGSIDYESDTATAAVALTYGSADAAPAESDLDVVGDSADSRSVTIDGNRVSVTGSWEG